MKRYFRLLLLFTCIYLMAGETIAQTYWNGTAVKDWTGTGTETDPILISTAEQLAGLADSVNRHADFEGKYIELTADIWLTDFTADSASWLSWKPVGAFTTVPDVVVIGQGCTMDTCYFRGHFNGNGHTIYNLFTAEAFDNDGNYDPDDDDITIDYRSYHKGLFGFNAGTISNLHIANADWSGDGSTGILAANNTQAGIVTHCSVQGKILGRGVSGGLVGTNEGLIDSCTVNIIGNDLKGSLVGENASTGVIQYCNTAGTLQGTYGAGITRTNAGLIAFTHSQVNTTRKGLAGKANWADTGGFVDVNEGTVKCSTASGNVMVGSYCQAGAFCGLNRGRIESSYATGNVMGNAGGENTLAQFVVQNGYANFSLGSYETILTGTCINCFATGKCLTVNSDTESTMTNAGFAAMAARVAYVEADSFYCSKTVNCYFNTDAVPDKVEQSFGARGVSDTHMRSQAFVDTLNMIADWMGISQWEYRQGQLPMPTGIIRDRNPYTDGGNGTKDNPYLVSTKQHLEMVALLCNRGWPFEGEYIRQTADIALNAPMEQWGEQAPVMWHPIGESYRNSKVSSAHDYFFSGHYNGGFHKVENMYLDDLNSNRLGFFGTLHWGASVQNLSIDNVWMYGANIMGILAGSLGPSESEFGNHITLSQCFTSGRLENTKSSGNVGALVGTLYGRDKHILNCGSTAELVTITSYGLGETGAVEGYGSHIDWANNDTLVNYLYAGTVSGNFRGPGQGFSYYENAWFDESFLPANHNVSYSTSLSTAELQSKQMVNRYNVSVDRWNAAHDLQLDYWQYRPGDYPRPARGVVLPHTVRFDARGGTLTDRAEMHVLDSSRIDYPATPVREGWLFAGWYADTDYKHVCVADTMLIVSDTTLYARWLPDEANDYDITPFGNKFATTFHIKTKAQLRGLSVYVNGLTENGKIIVAPHDMEGKTVVLDNDIFLNDTTDWHLWGKQTYAEQWTPIGVKEYSGTPTPFKGVFDGQGHTVYGLYYCRPVNGESASNVGLFGYVSAGEIKNVHIRNANVRAYASNVSLLAALSYADISGCTAQGILQGGSSGVGGLIGEQHSKVSSCGWEGSIVSTASYVGGLVGYQNTRDSIMYCYARGTVAGDCGNIGGLTGKGNCANSYAICKVTGTKLTSYADHGLGGLIGGYDYYSACRNSYSGSVIALTGTNSSNCTYHPLGGTQQNSYYDKELNGMESATEAPGKMTAQMKRKSTYLTWDFDNVWGRKDTINGGYPYLRWEYAEYIPDDPDADYVPVESVTLDITEKEMLRGTSFRLTPTVLPENATIKGVTYTVSGDLITVDENGVVTALPYTYWQPITRTVTVHTIDGNKTATCTVTSINPYIDFGSLYYYQPAYKEIQLNCTVYPDSLTAPLLYSSQYDNIATVDENGLIRTLAEGKTYIYVSTIDGRVKGSTQLTIYEKHITSVRISNTHNNQIGLGETWRMNVYYSPSDATNPKMHWSSSDPGIVSVDDEGNLTGVALGTATITVTADDGGYTASQEIEVITVPVTGVRLNDVPTLKVGETYQMEAVIEPANATDKRLLWTSDNESVLRIDETGLLTALAESRRANITVTTVDGGYTASVRIRVSGYADIPVLTEFAIEPDMVTLYEGDKIQLSVLIEPLEAEAYTTVGWQSGNPAIVTVDNGWLTAVAEGVTEITAVASCGAVSKTASCAVTVASRTSTATDTPRETDSADVQKVLKDGTIFILRNGKVYTVTGIEVK